MTIQDVKQIAKEKYDQELTDAEAEEVLNAAIKEGAIGEEELAQVSGGISGHAGDVISYVIQKMLENMRENRKPRN